MPSTPQEDTAAELLGDGLGGSQIPRLDRIALWSLAAQHFSTTWTQRTAEFATYLFLIDLFPSSLLPSALYGLFTTLSGVIFGGNVGRFVDHPARLTVVRINIVIAKTAVTAIYACLFILLDKYSKESALAAQEIHSGHPVVWSLFSICVLASCISKLSDIGLSVAIERDWVITISEGCDAHLSTLNLWLRRIDLLCKLVSPLFASLLTATIGNVKTTVILGSIAIGGLLFELIWIKIVWNCFPALKLPSSEVATGEQIADERLLPSRLPLLAMRQWVQRSLKDWMLFIKHPVFPSSVAISLLYFTTLSFDGTMISWLKTNTYSDSLISGMRGIAVCTGLAGTILMPILERKIGLARTGSWSIWFEAFSLVPAVISFFIGSHQGTKAATWNQALLFGSVAVSRIGLWSFDLCQLKLLQLTLADHPRRNTLTGLQYSLQNILDLLKYVMIIGFSQPSDFKFTVLFSFAAVLCGACFYLVYLRRERGHVLHSEWFTVLKDKWL